MLDAGHDSEKRRLSRTRWPEETQDLSGLDIQRHLVERDDVLEPKADALDRHHRAGARDERRGAC
jgi:hypothetical protein